MVRGDGRAIDLDEIAADLYALRPDAFAAARDDQVRKARAEHRQPLARELAKLRKPTQSAWLVNLLWRDQPDLLDQLLDLGGELSQAQAQASGATLQRLTAQRRALEAGLIRRARELAERAGVDVSATMEREAQETLAAALVRPEVADEVRSGRLVKPAAYAGFGTLPAATTLPRPAAPSAAEDARPAARREAKIDDFAARAAQRAQERRAEAERQVQAARGDVDAAASALRDEQHATEAAKQRQQVIAEQLDQLRTQLRNLEHESAAAERAAAAAVRRQDEAARAHAATRRSLERAEKDLQTLASDDNPRP